MGDFTLPMIQNAGHRAKAEEAQGLSDFLLDIVMNVIDRRTDVK